MDDKQKVDQLRLALRLITVAFGDYASFRDEADFEELVKAMNNGLKTLKDTE